MVECGHLGDHPANADAGEVRRPAAERIDKGRGVDAQIDVRAHGAMTCVIDQYIAW